MIEIFALSLLVFVLAMMGLAIGILTGRRAPGAGCAGMGATAGGSSACRVCGRPAGTSTCPGAPPSDQSGKA